MIRRENVHCNSASVVPSFWFNGPVNSVQTYCGEEIAIMAITPRMSCDQRFKYHAVGIDGAKVVVMTSPSYLTVRADHPTRRILLFWPRWTATQLRVDD